MKRRGLFLDRDGVINEDLAYIGSIDRFIFKEGIFDFLRGAQTLGYSLIIVTNQSGVARGMYTEKDYEEVTAYMLAHFRAEGITINQCLSCFYLKGAKIPAYDRESFWRKPNSGMILEGALRLNIDLARSAMVGDSVRDIEAAQAAGIARNFLLTKDAALLARSDAVSDFRQLSVKLTSLG